MKKKLISTVAFVLLAALLHTATAFAATYAFYANECPRCGDTRGTHTYYNATYHKVVCASCPTGTEYFERHSTDNTGYCYACKSHVH